MCSPATNVVLLRRVGAAARPESVAARRRGRTPFRVASVDSAFARGALLERLGMDTEARFEHDAIEAAAAGSPDRIARDGARISSAGQASRAMRLAQKLIDGGQRDARAYRLLYPLVDRDELSRTANSSRPRSVARRRVDSAGVSFNPQAVSVATRAG